MSIQKLKLRRKLAILAAMNPVQLELTVEPLVFDGPATENRPGLKLTVKRYTSPASDDEGLTLLFTHCIAAREFLWQTQICLRLTWRFLQQIKNSGSRPLNASSSFSNRRANSTVYARHTRSTGKITVRLLFSTKKL
jgi:hypothetical protein